MRRLRGLLVADIAGERAADGEIPELDAPAAVTDPLREQRGPAAPTAGDGIADSFGERVPECGEADRGTEGDGPHRWCGRSARWRRRGLYERHRTSLRRRRCG